ncbi:hypothetical protein Glove_315g48 [Diversispora epigaea]|uniref:Uncharacterized protein n=1 Tax=Diversispora epigaea TaxID=1348612 RepID=A0A397HU12_9GLOM|nr:hypothetical protein Glove_315g48 [Diversispora epigaea]
MSEVKEKEFELFFQDKSNVSMSSYKVDTKTNLPILYLQDQKQALWSKFEETYPNANCTHIKYREDLGGLCLTCNDYGFEAFQNLMAIARNTFHDKKILDNIINRIEKLRMHMKRNFERELVINKDGTLSHDECINHCLLYAFGECDQYYISRCINYQTKEHLKYFLSHQARKTFLNAQFKLSLAQLDEDGALLIADYKMRFPDGTVHHMSEVKEKEFELFFQDKSNVSMSSYKVDTKTNLPILYLQDQKQALWSKFEETYPNDMKKTSFMTRLANCTHIKYREDLGGLCLTCNDYGFEAFQNLMAIARNTFHDKKILDNIINRIEKLRMHMKRNFERELVINKDGTLSHDECINHCLLYAFGECDQYHISRCINCDEFFEFFNFLYLHISFEQKNLLDQTKEHLKYFLSHQARKTFLNAQFKLSLAQLDEDSALLIADYKMRVLPKSARETKEQFFGKREWTLHTILIFTQKENEICLDVNAYDHWSTDTKQDA